MHKTYKIKRVSHLKIGDPMYFEAIENGTAKREKQYVFDEDIRCCDVCELHR